MNKPKWKTYSHSITFSGPLLSFLPAPSAQCVCVDIEPGTGPFMSTLNPANAKPMSLKIGCDLCFKSGLHPMPMSEFHGRAS